MLLRLVVALSAVGLSRRHGVTSLHGVARREARWGRGAIAHGRGRGTVGDRAGGVRRISIGGRGR